MDIEYIREWFRFANRNLGIAEHLEATYHPKPLEDICFNCHQSAEKYLKGYLIYHSSDMPPRTHNLMELCALCAAHNNSFKDLIRACGSLNLYAISPKYPHEIYLDEGLMKKAIGNANEIKAFPPLAALRELLEQEEQVSP